MTNWKCLLFYVIVTTFFACRNSQTNVSCIPDTSSFFPLITGSYWIYQDSSFTDEGEQIITEDLGLESNTIRVYKVILIRSIDGNIVAKIDEYFLPNGNNDTVNLEYRIDKNGYLFEGQDTQKGFTMGSLPTTKVYPNEGDTVYENGRKEVPLVYNVKGDTCYLRSISKTYSGSILKFVRGIGLVGRVYGNEISKNLIEYRIDNGPVIKKHWLMESPENK
jgi:hypothetical protein